MPPFWFFIHGVIRKVTERANSLAVNTDRRRGHSGTRRFIHKRHELVREARHGATDTNSADVRAPADPRHPTTFGHIAIDDRTPATQLHNALERTVLRREIPLLVIASPVAPLMHRLPE